MTISSYQHYYAYLAEHVITPFYENRLNNLKQLNLHGVLKRKNPYLFKAKNIEVAGELVKSIVDAFLSSQEETIFGNLLEGFAIYVSKSLYSGFKSELKSVDLEFVRDGVYHIVGIKSGVNWGNSDQVNKMRDNFKVARDILRERGITNEIVAVNGCIYGKDNVPFKTHKDAESSITSTPDKSSGISSPVMTSYTKKLLNQLIKNLARKTMPSRKYMQLKLMK
jgi:hypothetical protein